MDRSHFPAAPATACTGLPEEIVVDVAVIGGGPAALAAASTAAGLGLKVTVLDEQPAVGGQYLTGLREPLSPRAHVSRAEREGGRLLAALAAFGVNVWTETLVWNLERGPVLSLYRGGMLATLRCGAVILASGAREQSVPFPGWTLPGVTTVGAGQLLAKRHNVLPGKRILLAGSGPLLPAAAAEMLRLGADVVAVLEATDPRSWLGHATAFWRQWERLGEGARYLRALRRAGTPYRFGRAVIAAHGETRVERVDVAALDASGRPLLGTVEQIDVDALCISFGLTPNIELAELAGAALAFDAARGGWTPELDAHLQTTVPGLYVAGEAGGVAGADAALLTGRVAGLAAARQLGRLRERDMASELQRLASQRSRQARFGRMLNTLFAPPPGLEAIITDDTILCRCEEVCAGDVRAAVYAGAHTLDALKTWTRVGQGPCQGRTCGPILARLIASRSGRRLSEISLFAVRPPVKPVPLGAFAAAPRRRCADAVTHGARPA